MAFAVHESKFTMHDRRKILRSAEDGGKLATIQIWNGDIEVDKVVLYSILLLKARGILPEYTGYTLTAFFTLCRINVFAKTLLYSCVPTYYTWNASRKSFERPKGEKKKLTDNLA
ncbi:unnamed protein product [Onchocerca flexuosa]|uniref:40S ribosomal protein S24 n=1 Tax=Onchocerca flexuosa TaxID=387005 RepID=A0A183H9L1_9BILA|nr:unnamed protein product [Onchocerca flexuosa]